MIYSSMQWIDDIDEVSEELPELNELAGKSVLITGASGLICSAVTDIFIRYNETHPVPIKIIAAGRKFEKIADRFGRYCDRAYFTYFNYDASKTDNRIDIHADYIIHGAGNASPHAIITEPVETMLSNFDGLYFLLAYARKNSSERLLYISSSEVYGIKRDIAPYNEKDFGYIDIMNPRNSYSVGKRAAETLCSSFREEYGINSVIVRPGHIYGPTALPHDNRISSAFAHSAARGETLVMKSSGSQQRSYCYCLDCASAIVKVLMKGASGEAYNISNPDSIVTIRQMAEQMAVAGGVELRVEQPEEYEKESYNPMECSSLNSDKLLSLSWKAKFDLCRGVDHTIRIIKSQNEEKGLI